MCDSVDAIELDSSYELVGSMVNAIDRSVRCIRASFWMASWMHVE